MTEQCGWPTEEGHGCTHPPTEGERCWLHAEDAEKAGRITKFNDERARDAIEAARMSKSRAGCARAANVSHTTLARWIEANPTFEDGNGEEVEFRAAFAHARRDGETVLVQGGLRNDEVDTSMAKFLLATSFGYVKTERREHLVDDDADLASDRPTAEFIVINESDDE